MVWTLFGLNWLMELKSLSLVWFLAQLDSGAEIMTNSALLLSLPFLSSVLAPFSSRLSPQGSLEEPLEILVYMAVLLSLRQPHTS